MIFLNKFGLIFHHTCWAKGQANRDRPSFFLADLAGGPPVLRVKPADPQKRKVKQLQIKQCWEFETKRRMSGGLSEDPAPVAGSQGVSWAHTLLGFFLLLFTCGMAVRLGLQKKDAKPSDPANKPCYKWFVGRLFGVHKKIFKKKKNLPMPWWVLEHVEGIPSIPFGRTFYELTRPWAVDSLVLWRFHFDVARTLILQGLVA